MKTIKQIVYDYLRTPTNDERFIHDGYYALEHAVRYGIEEAQKWISVDSELPKDDGWYLCKLDKQTVPGTLHFQNPNEWSNTGIFKVTHWRPIELK